MPPRAALYRFALTRLVRRGRGSPVGVLVYRRPSCRLLGDGRRDMRKPPSDSTEGVSRRAAGPRSCSPGPAALLSLSWCSAHSTTSSRAVSGPPSPSSTVCATMTTPPPTSRGSSGRNKRVPPDTCLGVSPGGSSAREACSEVRRSRPMSRDSAERRVAAWNASTSNQDFAETLAIVDNVPDSPTWVVIGIGPGRFTASPAAQRAGGGRDRTADEERALEALRGARSTGTTRARATILPGSPHVPRRRRRRQRSPPTAPRATSTTRSSTRWSAATLRRRRTAWWRRGSRERTHGSAPTWTTTSRCSSRSSPCAQERGLHVVLVELPLNRDGRARPLR